MKTSNRITRLADDLVAHWTEPVLEILRDVGKVHVTVQSEIEAWQVLNDALRAELREQSAFRSATNVSFDAVREQVLVRAASVMARKYNLLFMSRILEDRVGQSIRDQRETSAERELFEELVGELALRADFKSRRQTDFAPRHRLSVVGG
jgi:hypothetical protein